MIDAKTVCALSQATNLDVSTKFLEGLEETIKAEAGKGEFHVLLPVDIRGDMTEAIMDDVLRELNDSGFTVDHTGGELNISWRPDEHEPKPGCCQHLNSKIISPPGDKFDAGSPHA